MTIKNIYLIIAILTIIIIFFTFYLHYNKISLNGNVVLDKKMSYVIIDEIKIEVELAQTKEQWAHGLMLREALDKDKGMLFIFPDSEERSFWMKNTLIPLDIIFIDSSQRILNIEEAEPCKKESCILYKSTGNAKYVLEINRGFAAKKGIKKGDRVVLDIQSNLS